MMINYRVGKQWSWLFAVYITAAGAAPLSPADRDQLQIQQQNMLQSNQLQRDELQRSVQPEISDKVTHDQSAGPCFLIKKIVINNASLLSATEKKRVTAPLLGQCVNIAQIEKLTRDISDWYLSRGYITSRAFIPEQDINSGILTLSVLEGRLQQIRLDKGSSTQLKMAFPRLEGGILNLRDIEQGMEQINRLRTTPVQIEILPGDTPGFSIVNLTATPEFPLTAALSFDNSGQKSTGVGQVAASLTANNLLGIVDQWFISGGRSSAFSSSRNARNLQSGVSVPYGYWLMNYNYSWSDYRNRFENNNFSWLSHGDSQIHRATASWVAFRNGQSKTALVVGIDHRISRNWLNDTLLESSSRKLTSLQFGLNHTQKMAGGVATFNPMFSHGVSWLDAESDSGKSDDLPKADFRKWSLSSSFQRPLTQNLWWLSSAYGQWSPDRLYGSERLTIGGESSVRGFKEQYLSGDNGGYLRNELNYALFTLPLLGQINGLLALDGGWLESDRYDRESSGTLWGSAVGLTSGNSYFATQLTLGLPVKYPDWLGPDRLSAYYRISLLF
ncbi:ShlB/FhaC/HecB family hemolysin secretion/activation protein [Erwinia sp. MMLR14_017]|uniref:ShlB/FhaC/HecB family hemolysin secretion/activation protein n=1 Tax=Erwinia sp. MMLR14_017 TaxID=3093842 RepID=UPI00399F6F36